MSRPADDPFVPGSPAGGDAPCLDREAFEAPRRLSRDEGRAAAGPDWAHIRLLFDEDPEND